MQYFIHNYCICICCCYLYRKLLQMPTTPSAAPAAMLASSMSYLLYFLSVTISGLLSMFFTFKMQSLFYYAAVCAFLLFIMHLPFRFRRFQKGMPFLNNPLYAVHGMTLSIMILILAIFFNSAIQRRNHLVFIPLLFVCIMLIYLYWKVSLTKTYIDKANRRNIEELNRNLLEKQKYIESLEQDNRQLARLIHKDNKLIPAMEYAVMNYLENNTEDTEREKLGRELIAELNTISAERKGILKQQTVICEKLLATGMMRIDALLQYMQQKAAEHNILLHISLQCNMQQLIEKTMPEPTFHTLLADLVENAITATHYREGSHILLCFGMLSHTYAIHIFDSGTAFPVEVLKVFGNRQITTHKETGGNGIGLMEIHYLLKKHKASLLIDEFTLGEGLYTKKISVLFNRLDQRILYTMREEEELNQIRQYGRWEVIKK